MIARPRPFWAQTIYCEACGDIVNGPCWQTEGGKIVFRGCWQCLDALYPKPLELVRTPA